MRNTVFSTFSSFCSSGGNEEAHMPVAPNLSVDLHILLSVFLFLLNIFCFNIISKISHYWGLKTHLYGGSIPCWNPTYGTLFRGLRKHNIGTGFYVDPHACNDLHLGSFTPLSSTQEYSTQTIDLMPEGGNGCKATSVHKDHQKIPAMMSPDQDTTSNTRNTRKRANAAEATLMAASKKGLYAEDGHQHSQESSTSSVPPMKAPMRSHKLGDRITALQQLVSPFGKTDTASVLQEATVYINLLQEQIQVLSNPYFRFRASLHPQGILGEDKSDLRSKGLCLVPASTTDNLPHDAAHSNPCISTGPNTHVCL